MVEEDLEKNFNSLSRMCAIELFFSTLLALKYLALKFDIIIFLHLSYHKQYQIPQLV